jgi:hypothetical protein
MPVRYVKIYRRKRDDTLNANVVKHPRKSGHAIRTIRVDL